MVKLGRETSAGDEALAGKQLVRLVFLFRNMRDRLPIHTLCILGHLAEAGEAGVSMKQLGRLIDKPQSTLSRTILELLDEYHGEKGPGLVEQFLDPSDYRSKFCRLTPKGRQLMREVGHILN